LTIFSLSSQSFQTKTSSLCCQRTSWYSKHPNTEPSGIRMVTFRTLFGSGYQTVRISKVRDRTYLSGFQMVETKSLA
jgi:hypothetical protein